MKKLNRLKLYQFREMSDSEMKNVEGGYVLPEVTVYGCYDPFLNGLIVHCTETDARMGQTCRAEDCKHVGTCIFAPIVYTPICVY